MRSRNRRQRDNFSVAQFFLKLVWQNGEDWKRIRTLEWLSEGNKHKKARRATVCGQLCMDNISNGLNESDDSSILDSSGESLSASLLLLSSSEIFTEPFFSLTMNICPPYTIIIASSAWRTFASSLVDVFSFVLHCFRFFELVHGLNVVYVYL